MLLVDHFHWIASVYSIALGMDDCDCICVIMQLMSLSAMPDRVVISMLLHMVGCISLASIVIDQPVIECFGL